MNFVLDGRLAAGSAPILDLGLCQARLQRDARFPWIVLIPRRAAVQEIEALSPQDRAMLTEEIVRAGAAVRAAGAAIGFRAEKLNVGALGNLVPQLHVHVVGRRAGDAAWPGPVWGFGEPEPQAEAALACAIAAARAAFTGSTP